MSRPPAPASAHVAADPGTATRGRRWLPALTVGAIAGIDNIGVGLAIASLLFSGPLAAGLGIGVGAVLLSAVILALLVGLGSGFRNAVALVQESSVAVLAATVVSVLAGMPGPVEHRVATVLAIIGASTLLTGAVLWLTGALRMGRFVRLLPYPVVAGFVAASGYLLVEGALVVLSGETSPVRAVAMLSGAGMTAVVAPTVVFALVLLAGLRLWRSPLAAPTLLVGAIAGFYVVLAALGWSVPDARQAGLLPWLEGSAAIALPTPDLLGRVQWDYVLAAWPGMLSVAAISLVGMLLNTGGVELASGREVDPDRELRVGGWSNLVAGLVGGPAGYTGLGMTVMAGRLGAHGREAGLATACVLFAGLAFAQPLVSHMPVFVTAGLVLYLGLDLLATWLVATHRRLPTSEWLIIVLITLVVAVAGFITGLVVGVLVSAAVFIYNYSRLPVIRAAGDGASHRSAVDRSVPDSRRLEELGDTVAIIRLQGYLFFATADRIVDHVRGRLASRQAPLSYLLIDFRHVSGIDSAAVASFIKIADGARRLRFLVILTHLDDHVTGQLRRGGLAIGHDPCIRVEADLDHALEYCEEALLTDDESVEVADDPRHRLADMVGGHPRVADLVEAMQRVELSPGETLIHAGEMADDIYFVASGWVRVQITLADGRVLRLRSMTAGAVVGEVAHYLDQQRTADVLCEEAAVVYKMSRRQLSAIEAADAELAALFHRLVAVSLCDKLAISNRMIQAAQA